MECALYSMSNFEDFHLYLCVLIMCNLFIYFWPSNDEVTDLLKMGVKNISQYITSKSCFSEFSSC